MKNLIMIIFKVFICILRLVFFPIKIICNTIYGVSSPNLVGFAWYSKEEYQKLIDSSADRLDEIVPTHELWQTKAKKNIDMCLKKGWIVIKVAMDIKQLEIWLGSNGLSNTGENRQKYVNYRMQHFLDDAII